MLCFTERARERDKSEMCVDSEHAIGTPRTVFTGMLWHMSGTYPDGGIDAQQNGDSPLQGRHVIIPAFGRNVSAPLTVDATFKHSKLEERSITVNATCTWLNWVPHTHLRSVGSGVGLFLTGKGNQLEFRGGRLRFVECFFGKLQLLQSHGFMDWFSLSRSNIVEATFWVSDPSGAASLVVSPSPPRRRSIPAPKRSSAIICLCMGFPAGRSAGLARGVTSPMLPLCNPKQLPTAVRSSKTHTSALKRSILGLQNSDEKLLRFIMRRSGFPSSAHVVAVEGGGNPGCYAQWCCSIRVLR
jgi:hypothetical protein